MHVVARLQQAMQKRRGAGADGTHALDPIAVNLLG
jgi:hypothetical protein